MKNAGTSPSKIPVMDAHMYDELPTHVVDQPVPRNLDKANQGRWFHLGLHRLWHVSGTTNEETEADEGTRTLDLLHGKESA